MKNLLLLLLTTIFLSCSQIPTGELSGILDDNSTEVQMTKELMKKYSEGKFREIADMISDDSGEYYFNNVKVDKEGWLSAAMDHEVPLLYLAEVRFIPSLSFLMLSNKS